MIVWNVWKTVVE